MTARLFDVDPKTRRRLAGNLPVLVDTSRACPDCAAPTVSHTVHEPALFRHGGYGATRTSTIDRCARFCGWSLVRAVIETNPRR